MSMAPEHDSFEQLRKLLALKRHELPPPRYFDDFSLQVIVRIKAGEADRSFQPYAWLQRFWAALDTRPALAGAFGAAVCALLIGGVIYSESANPSDVAAWPQGRSSPDLTADAASRPLLSAIEAVSLASNTNVTLPQPLGDSLFGSIPMPSVTPAALTIPLGN
jgi:hypothetical protein